MNSRKVYADNNGTTKVRCQVINIIQNTLVDGWANPSCQSNEANVAQNVISLSRKRISNLINCSADEVLFTSGGTESNNMVLHSLVHTYRKPHVVISSLEHDSVSLCAKRLEKQVTTGSDELDRGSCQSDRMSGGGRCGGSMFL